MDRKKIKLIAKSIAIQLRGWNRIFCKGMTCKVNLRRDAIIVAAAILLSGVFILADRYLYNGRIQAKETAAAQIMSVPTEQTRQMIMEKIFRQTPERMFEEIPVQEAEKTLSQESQPAQPSLQSNENVSKPADVKKSAPKVVATRVVETKSTGKSCIKIPANILSTLKNPPVPPDGKMKNGKLVCHVLAVGKKDNPHKSDKNPKGEWGGCCYDPDEVPNPNCCYPVGSVYEKMLERYFENPFPRRKR